MKDQYCLTLQAAILKIKLKHLNEYAAARNKVADYYDKALANHPKLKTPTPNVIYGVKL